jgi:hypothetical protein
MTKVEQVGGTHYNAEYQHWDWAAETQLGYLEGNATKYVSRWRKKNGVDDLKKALSYVKKLAGCHDHRLLVPAGFRPLRSLSLLRKFEVSARINQSDMFIIHRLDAWTTPGDLIDVAKRLEKMIKPMGIDHPAPFGYPGEDSGCE